MTDARTIAITRVRRESWIPNPQELQQNPELAGLASLDAILEITQSTLIAQLQVLHQSEPERTRQAARQPTDWTARTITILADLLRDQIRYYRHSLRHDNG